MRLLVAACLLPCLSGVAGAQDFSRLTRLAEAAVAGVGVEEAVPGFEIRLTRDGEVLYHRAFGDWTVGRVAKVDSSTKTLSGALVVSLAETGEGGFSLDSRLADFLPAYDKPGHRDITVRQAFSHTSGLPGNDVTSPALLAPGLTLQESASLIAMGPLEHGPPGSAFAYGGLSMQAVGAAMEVASGEAYVDLFAERITGPLGLADTRFYIASDTNPRVAAGVESTAGDFGVFMDMLLNDGVDRVSGRRVLAAESVAAMLTRQTTATQPIVNSPTGNRRYGVGVWLDQLGQAGPTVDTLAGGARGFHSWIDESEGLVFTFATDTTRFSNVEVLSSRMHAAILAALVPEPGAGVLAASAVLAAAAGRTDRRRE